MAYYEAPKHTVSFLFTNKTGRRLTPLLHNGRQVKESLSQSPLEVGISCLFLVD